MAMRAAVPTTIPQGAICITDYQSQGRGRFNRRWEAPPGSSVLFSVLLYPQWPVLQNGWLTMMAALAVAEAITTHTGLDTGIKWPNDVMLPVGEDWQKVSGILLEGEMTADGRCSEAILGIGINVNIPVSSLPMGSTPATSLLAVLNKRFSREQLLAELLVRLEERYEAALNGRSPQPAWQQRLITLGQPVTVSHTATGEQIMGTAVRVDEWGHLLVQGTDGHIHTITAADVTLRKK